MNRDKSSKKILLMLNTLCEDSFTCCECQSTTAHLSPKQFRSNRTQGMTGMRQRSKSQKNMRERQPFGIMETNIYDRIEYYKQNHKAALQEKQRTNRMIQLQNEGKTIKNKPDINQKSKLLYQKRKDERQLSPNVFDRLRMDQQKRSKEKIVKTIHRIKEVTPSKILNQYDLHSFASPKEIKLLRNIFKIDTK